MRGKGKLQIPRNIQRDEYDIMAKYRTGVDEQDSASYMTMELCKQDLFDLIASKGPTTSEPLAKYLFKQICNGVDALHTTAGFAHLDIKLENILISKDYKLKLCDFGFAQGISERITKRYGTESYMAPEVESNVQLNYMGISADIFSLGVILFIITFGAPPFTRAVPSDRNFNIFTRNKDCFWKMHPSVKKYVAKAGEVNPRLIDLLTSMLSADIGTRPASVKSVLEHPFFEDVEQQVSREALETEFKKLVDS